METRELPKYDGREGRGTFRAMTLDEAKRLQYGQHIWFVSMSGDARRVKVNGAPKTWKRDASRVEVPVKYGMYEYARFDARDIAGGRLLIEVTAVWGEHDSHGSDCAMRLNSAAECTCGKADYLAGRE